MSAPNTPFALPAPLGHGLQRRGEAVGVVAYVTVITEQEPSGVTRLPTSFTHGAFQTPPTFAKNDFGDLNTDTVRMVTLATLRAGKQSSLCPLAETATNYTHILVQGELVAARKQHHRVVHGVFFFILIR